MEQEDFVRLLSDERRRHIRKLDRVMIHGLCVLPSSPARSAPGACGLVSVSILITVKFMFWVSFESLIYMALDHLTAFYTETSRTERPPETHVMIHGLCVLLLVQPISCVQEYVEVINSHTVGSLTTPRASIKRV